MTWQEEYRQEGSAPDIFEREIVPRITALWAKDLVERADIQPGASVLDVACGTGVVAREAARRTQTGRVVGIDLNADMLRVARDRPSHDGTSIEWQQGSALALAYPDGSFDVVLCQLGLQFFPDKPLALTEMVRVLRPNGNLALSVFSALERTPIAHAYAEALDGHLGPGASSGKRAEHSFADAKELSQLAIAAGLQHVKVVPVVLHIRFPSARDYVRLQLTATPQARLLSALATAHDKAAAIASIGREVASALNWNEALGEISSEQECNVLVARKARC